MAALETKQQVILDVTIKESPGYLFGKIGVIDVCYLPCNSKANAETTKDALDSLPSEFFLRTVMTHSQENRHFLAVERYEESLFAHIERGLKLYQRKEIVRNLIEMGICLDKLMLNYGKLSITTMVMCKGKLKSFSIPDTEVETNASTHQAEQLCNIARSIIPPLPVKGNLSHEQSVQKHFFEKLRTCFSGYIHGLLRCLQLLLNDKTTKTSSAVEVVFIECKNQNQARDVPHRSKVMKAIQVQHLSSNEMGEIREQLGMFLMNLWTLGHIDETRTPQNSPAPWRGRTSHS